MVVESAAVYSASIISLMITYSLGSNAQYTVLDLVGLLLAIVSLDTEHALHTDCAAHWHHI